MAGILLTANTIVSLIDNLDMRVVDSGILENGNS